MVFYIGQLGGWWNSKEDTINFLNHITRFENDSLVTEILKYTSYFLIQTMTIRIKILYANFMINTDVEARDTAIIDRGGEIASGTGDFNSIEKPKLGESKKTKKKRKIKRL